MSSSAGILSAFVFIATAVTAALTGCAPEPADSTESTSAKASLATSDNDTVSLRAVDAAGLREVLDKHRGKVVLVDFWATWCLPCVEQFPHTVKMAGKYRERRLAVVSVSMDNPSAEPQVRAFLEKQGARFDNLLNNYSSPVTATKEFGLPGPVPCYRVYDRDGRLHREFSVDPRAAKQFTTADVEAAMEELL